MQIVMWILFVICSVCFVYNLLWRLSQLGMPCSDILSSLDVVEICGGLLYLVILTGSVSWPPYSTFRTWGISVVLFVALICYAYALVQGKRYGDPFFSGHPIVGWKIYFGKKIFYDGTQPVPGIEACNSLWFTHFVSGCCGKNLTSKAGTHGQKVKVFALFTALPRCTPRMFTEWTELLAREIKSRIDEAVDRETWVASTTLLNPYAMSDRISIELRDAETVATETRSASIFKSETPRT